MQILLLVLIVLHVLTGVFWAGSTFVLARTGGANAEHLAFPQFGAAIATMLMGIAVWALALRTVPPIPSLHVLGAGALCAVLAAVVQALALPAVRQLRASGPDEAAPRRRIAMHQRIAGVLLMITVVCMALWGHI
jgi:uncharacterized membrane protein